MEKPKIFGRGDSAVSIHFRENIRLSVEATPEKIFDFDP